MVKDIALDLSYLIALWIEGILYGVNTILFFICLYVLLNSSKWSARVNQTLLATASLLYMLCTIHTVTEFVRACVAFIGYPSKGATATEYFEQAWVWSEVFSTAVYVTINILSDSLLIYRLYIVWKRNVKVVIGPIIMLVATCVCGYACVYWFSALRPGPNSEFSTEELFVWGTALFSLTMSTNVIITALIAGRLWWYGHLVNSTLGVKHSRKYSQAMAIVVESGTLASVSQLIMLVLYVCKSNTNNTVCDCLAQILGIVPILIIVRVGLGIDSAVHNMSPPAPNIGNVRSAGIPMHVHKVIDISEYIDSDVTAVQGDTDPNADREANGGGDAV